MRIATLQFAPKLGDVKGNIEKANALLKKGKTISVDGEQLGLGLGVDLLKPDVLVLPEMALTGYNFPSLEAITPYLETFGDGPSSLWARETAKRLQCTVCVGYPEIEKVPQNSGQITCYNALLVVDKNGDFIHNYRKSFLYMCDEPWATEGDVERSFRELKFSSQEKLSTMEKSQLVPETKEKQVATSFGICMDINPYKFEAPFDKWEFASRVLDAKSQLVILSMAWTSMLSAEELEDLKDRPDMDTFNYWLQRFWPLIKRKMQHEVDLDGGVAPDSPKRIIIVFANRSGEDPPADETKPPVQYVGSSTILAITQRPEKDADAGSGASESETENDLPFDVKILCWDMLGAREEGICFADTTADPKMVFALKRASK